MFNRYLIIILFLPFALTVTAQVPTIQLQNIEKTGNNYHSYVVVDNHLLAIGDSSNLVIWDLNTLDTIHFPHNGPKRKFTAVAKDRNRNIFLGTDNGEIFKLDLKTLSCTQFFKIKYYVHSIFFTSTNKMLLIIPYAIYDPLRDILWSKFKHSDGLITAKRHGIKTNRYFVLPHVAMMDSHDRIWMSDTYGEFGSSIQVFDAKNFKILSDKTEGLNKRLLHTQSFFEDNNGDIYISSGLQHFDFSGSISKIGEARVVTNVFTKDNRTDTTFQGFIKGGIFIGPATFNKKERRVYFSSNEGFYKASFNESGNLDEPELLFNPEISWEREPMAMGIAMAITSLEFISDDWLLFLTSRNGFGLYNGVKLVFFK